MTARTVREQGALKINGKTRAKGYDVDFYLVIWYMRNDDRIGTLALSAGVSRPIAAHLLKKRRREWREECGQ